MFYFTRQEKIVILFITGAIILGLGVQWFRARGNLSVDSIKTEEKVKPVNSSDKKKNHPVVSNQNRKININFAPIHDLESLPGIGPKIAAEIISYREKSGKFEAVEDIKKVRGIGEKKFDKIKDKISINDETTMP